MNPKRRWTPASLIRSPFLRWALLLLAVVYIALAITSLEIDWARVQLGWARSQRLVAGFLRPNFTSRWVDISHGVLESLTMTVVATVLGVLFSVPLALGAARNIAPRPVYLLSRAWIALSRSFQEVIVAIFFVVMVGFGPLAGALTLSFSSVGFLGKLLSEEIEGISPKQVEAIRATGASWWQTLVYGVWPQILPRFVGLSVYRLDINFRESAIIGVVGAGGIGATLTTAFDLYDFQSASAILLTIIAIVLITEACSNWIRRLV